MSAPRRVRREDDERFRRCCPYCFQPVKWNYYGDVALEDGWPYIDLKTERPACDEHGALPLWLVIDTQYPVTVDRTVPAFLKSAIVAIATIDDLPCVVRDGVELARILPRFLWEPILVDDARRMRARWKLTAETRRRARTQPTLCQIDLAALERGEWQRRAA